MAKSKAIATIDRVKTDLVITFADGEVLKFDPTKAPDHIKEQLLYHGAIQKTRDSYANAKGDVNWARAQAEGVVEALLAGQWNRRGGGAGSSILIEAIARIKKMELPDARAAIEKLDDEQLTLLKASKTVKRVIKEIEAERARAADTGEEDDALNLV